MPTVSEPASIAEAAAVLGRAGVEGLRVSIEREGGDLVLSTRRLGRLLEHEAGDLTATVEAGIRLGELNARLLEEGQMLALDPPGDPTVGGALAGDLFGPRVHRYGRPRDLVLGVTVVLGDGTVANAGGKVVKNVAGYDLSKLFCGSRGRLGLVARASLRLHPVPGAQGTLVVPVGGPEEAALRVDALRRSQLLPSSVDLLWPGRLAVRFEGGEGAVAEQLAQAKRILGGSEDGAVWDEVAARQLAARGRAAIPAGELATTLARTPEALVRVGPISFLYLPEERAERWSPLAERVRAEFDPEGTFV